MKNGLLFRCCLLLLVGLICFSLTSCINDPAEVAAFQQRFDPKTEIATDVRILYSDSAKTKVVVAAPTMHNFVDPGKERQEFPDGLHVTFLDEQEDTSSTLVANWGVYLLRDNRIVVRDSVVWESVDLQRLETEELNWDEKEERIHTNKFVVLRQPDYLIYGYGLEADQDFKNATVLQVSGRVPVERPAE
ncbi:MAG: LPS export ABC transporter periplasmic protein LptC [Bacteroidota bacterium]